MGVIEEMLGCYRCAIIDQLHVVAKLSIIRSGEELPIVGGQCILSVCDSASFKIIGDVSYPIII